MRSSFRALAAAIGAGALAGLAAGTGCSAQYCSENQGSLFCGGQGTPAPELDGGVSALSACEPRAVMPVFFSLIDQKDPSLAGLRGAVADLGAARCLSPNDLCTSDSQCQVGSCSTANSPLTDVLGVTLSGMAAISKDPVEQAGLAAPGCLSAADAQNLPPDKRSRICELRRMLDYLLGTSGGVNLINSPAIRTVLLSLLNYIQGKTDPSGATHYDLLPPLGSLISGTNQKLCDPAALWAVLDNTLGYLDPSTAKLQLGNLLILLDDPYTQTFLANFNGTPGPKARDSFIVLVNSLAPAITTAASGPAALDQVVGLINPVISNAPQSFKDKLNMVLGVDLNTNKCPVAPVPSSHGLCEMLGVSTGIFPPLQKVVSCTASAEVRLCADPALCTSHENALIGFLYDVLSLPQAQGGLDLATVVDALYQLTTADTTGQTGRTLRLIVQGIETQDSFGNYIARDAINKLAADALTAQEGQKLIPALSVLIEKQVVVEFFNLLHDLLYTCSPPPTTH